MDMTLEKATPQTKPLQISLEMMAYLTIFALALVLRVVALDQVPLDDRQAHEALAALHRVDPDLNGDPVVARFPLMTFFNQTSFFVLDQGNFGARIATAVVGALLIWGPFLWRGFLGRSTALAMAVLLAFSAVALASSRQMGGVTWTMAMVFLVGWLVRQYVQTQEKRYAIGTTMAFGTLLLLTDPSGIIVTLGLFTGLLAALWRTNQPVNLGKIFNGWPWVEGVMATGVLMVIVGTGFFATPQSLTEVGNTFTTFVAGLTERIEGAPRAFGLLVAVRYDLGLVFFGLVGVYFAVRDGNFVSRFFAGWFAWSLLMGTLYLGATPDAGLWVIVPASGLTALMVTRMLRSASSGYWVVPGWAIPVHAAVTATLMAAIVLNGIKVGWALQRESLPTYFHQIDSLSSDAEIGTFDDNAAENTFEIYVDSPRTVTIQVQRMDRTIDPVLRIENFDREVIAGPFFYPEDNDRGIVEQVNFFEVGTHYLMVSQNIEREYQRGQFVLLTHPEDVEQRSILGLFAGYKLDTSAIEIFSESITAQTVQVITVLVAVFLLMLLIIGFFLAGSLWGTRAAWRGLGFGLLFYFLIAGLALGWQSSVTFAENPRELWQTKPTSHRIERLTDTLAEMSRFDNGERHQLTITVQAPDDGALAWALRHFDHVDYVDGLGIEVATGAVIAPFGQELMLGADYVGQDFALSGEWALSDLSWMDFLAWLNVRETRFQPLPAEHYMLWVRKDVYGVQEVSTQ